MMAVQIFGKLSYPQMKAAEEAAFHSSNAYFAVVDHKAMWEESTLEAIGAGLPKQILKDRDVYLLLAECVSNAAVHAKADMLAIFVRQREGVTLVTFFQDPPMSGSAMDALERARHGLLPDLLEGDMGGLGLPIIVRLADRVTMNADRTKLQLWFRR